MPPKQVYGKRTAAKPSTSYAKFISPRKDAAEATTGQEEAPKGRAEKPAKREAVARIVKEEPDVGGLVGVLDGLRIDDRGAKDPEQPIQRSQNTREIAETTRHKPTGKSWKKKKTRTREPNEPTQPKDEAEPVALSEQFHALDISKNDEIRANVPHERKQSPRRSKKTASKSVSKESIEDATNQDRAAKSKQQAEQQTAPETPKHARRLKAVVIPKPSLMPQLPTPEDPYASYVSSLLSLQSYGRSIMTFKEWSASLEPHFTVSKIAEASFSEVYRLSASDTACSSMKESVLKLVPLRSAPNAPLRKSARSGRNTDAQAQTEKEAREEEESWKSQVEDVHSEVKLLQNLNHIPGFTNFRELTVLQGRPSKGFIDAWKSWNKSRPKDKKSWWPDPSKKASYDDVQLWAVIEMQDAGTDVEKVMRKGGLSTVWEIWDIFWGVCLSVAKAEEACRFEHRDLHLENICIRSSRTESEEDLVNPVIKDPLGRRLGFTGLETTVIDYTLSRADVSSSASRRSSLATDASSLSQSSPCTPSTAPEVAFLDLNKDMSLFAGDASEEYQYEIYRYMRGAVLYDDPLQFEDPIESQVDQPRRSPRKMPQHIRFDESEQATPHTAPLADIWRSFHPKTNLVWAHFLLYKLLEHLDGNEPSNLSSTQIMRNVEASSEEKSKIVKKTKKMYKVLERVAELLDPGALAKKDGLGSMKELALLAMEERWLRVGDVAGA
jgi:serine/threonine-protein kinase haspin